MTLSRRGFLAATGGLAAAVTLSACGQNTGRNDASSSTNASNTPGSSAGPKVELTQWYHEYGEKGVQEAVKRYAAEYPNATVTVGWQPGEYAKAVSAALLTSKFPDVFEFEMGPTIDMIKAGQVADMTEVIGSAKDQFNQPLIKRFTFQDKIWAIPQVIDMHLLYYRKSMLADAGVQVPTTFDELVEAVKAVKAKTKLGMFAGNDGGLAILGGRLPFAAGFEQFNAARTELGFNDPAFVEALTRFREFYKSGSLLPAASADWYDGAAFVNEECAFQWGGLWSMTDIQAAHKDDFGVMAFPKMGANGKDVVPFGAFGSCVAAKGPHVDAAKAFAAWLWIDQEDKQVDFANSYGTHIPAKPALAPKASKLAEGAGADAAKLVADHGVADDIAWGGAIGDAYTTLLINVCKGGKDPKTELQALADKAKAELKRVNG